MNIATLNTASAMTVAELVDAFGKAIAAEAAAAEKRKAFRAQIESLGVGEYDGRLFRATVSTNPVTRVVPDMVRELLTPAGVALVSKTQDETRVSCKSRKT